MLSAAGADILVPVVHGSTILPSNPLHAAVFLATTEPKMLLCDPDAIESRHGGDQRGRTLLHQVIRRAERPAIGEAGSASNGVRT